ncbi:TIM barrel protein [soil metagenome]
MAIRHSVSTWALHSLLQSCGNGRPGDDQAQLMGDPGGSLSLLDVPVNIARRGFMTMELCHFHIPTRDADYLSEFRAALFEEEVDLWSLLIDDGNITDPLTSERDVEWTKGWIDTAATLGSKCVRIAGGKNLGETEKAIQNLSELADYASAKKVRVLTENWFETLSNPDAVEQVFDALGDKIGLCFDFGNWSGPDKYTNLSRIAKYATSCHAKCNYQNGTPDVADFEKCLEITRENGFDGPYTLVYGEPGMVWDSLAEQKTLLG